MNKLLITGAIISACCSFSATAFEEETTGFYGNLGLNHFLFENDRDIKDDNDIYFGLGYQFSDNWGFEIEYTEIETETDLSNPFAIDLGSLNLIYRQLPKGNDSVFWKLGAGQYKLESENEKAARLGLGYDFAVTDNFSWVLGLDTTFTNNNNPDFIAYAGLSYFFGSTKSSTPIPKPISKPAVVAKVQDGDNDGVIDANDSCPTSAPNVQVDSKGCELDSDSDGVKNSQDQCLSTPMGAKVDAKGCRIMLTENVSIKLNVQFPNNSSIISSDYRNEIEKVAKFMKQYPDTSVVIEGYTDDRGAAEYNRNLSQKRASAVMMYLVNEFSISQSRVSADGKGEENPIADNATSVGRATNRRVQAEIKTTVSKGQ